MRLARFYNSQVPTVGTQLQLDDDAAHHISKVLRMSAGQQTVVFSGDGFDYLGELTEVTKKKVVFTATEQQQKDNESPLYTHLAQGIARGDKMELIIQKAVELGINEITPILTERGGVKLNQERMLKKLNQWQKIAISACEQSGRAVNVVINAPIPLCDFINQETDQLKLNLHPKAAEKITELSVPSTGVRFIVGPEGGLNDDEIEQCHQAGFKNCLLGPRVLRTETAALSMLSVLQLQFGDFY